MNRWEDSTKHDPGWDSRTRMLADLIESGQAVLEFGAGRKSLRNMIDGPYDALDLPAFDLNNENWVELPKHDVAVFGGVLEYVNSIESVISKMTAQHIVLSYSARKDESIEYRTYNFWVTHLTYDDLLNVLSKYQYKLDSDVRWWGGTQMVAKFTK